MALIIPNLFVQEFINRFKKDFEQYWNFGKIERAYKLNRLISNDPKKIVRYDMPPYPFFGNLYAETVMVNLNAGIPNHKKETPKNLKEKGVNNFDDFYNYLFNFGEIRYYDGATVDAFDAKQIAYLLDFDKKTKLLGFEDRKEINKTCSYIPNLRRLLANRCQLELIPYGSTNFETKYFRNEEILVYFRELVDVICSVKRRIIFFNGSIFRFLLKRCENEYNVIISPRFGSYLIKKDGTMTRRQYYYSYGKLTWNNQEIFFVIGDSFSQQGLNGDLMRRYGELVIRDLFSNYNIFC
ncbi:hypothetical protein [Anoxybacillus sp. PDR2]|jgi:hypothetical protein|uniref:hypothetical protein n=1 Tax=Anoxybacillaceae TaxID=3120669 RepID=UPI0013174387|nr:hypothetical protein [Anoxybacillus sp. PDR2]QHC04702.1 hypothetical protein GRQ40_12615 [Anoxybacillus sp. PDR2]